MFIGRATIRSMPTRKTADANIDSAKATESAKKRSTAASKGSTSPAATHKRTATKKAKQPSAAGTADPVDILAAAEPVSKPVLSQPAKPSASATRAPVAAAVAVRPSREQIEKLAYSYWEARGFQG